MRRWAFDLMVATLAACVLAGGAVPRAGADDAATPPAFRLPGDVVKPLRYRVDLTLVPDQDKFTGQIAIDLEFTQAASVLWLSGERLTVREATLSTGSTPFPARVISEPKDFTGFRFDHPVGPGKATLHVTYEGTINRRDQQGIFQMKDGDQWYVYTQFENTGARWAYPCFDEPGYKVPWQLTLHVKQGQVAVSNTPIVSEADAGDGMKTVKFAQTRPLPSYLVAFAVGDFEVVNAGVAGRKNVPVHIVFPRGHSTEAKYAAETTGPIVNLLEKYFDVPYPYEKLDEVAIPRFDEAMENAAMVTYPSSLLLGRPADETLSQQREWVWVAAHELAHQWFGDLVTTAWWDDIWLNEGFASWTADKIVSQYHPEWHREIEALNSYQGAMSSDRLVSARRVRQPILSNDDIANAFDNITYDKGAALLNMFESYMGPEKFRQGIQRYLRKYAWQNATSAEFLAAVAGNDAQFAPAFSSFLDQPGLPLVTAGLDCQGGGATLDLAQQRFLPLGSEGAARQTWQIPVCVRYPAGQTVTRQCTLLSQPSVHLTLSHAQVCPAWVQANAGAAGYYLVLYQGKLLEALLKDQDKSLTLPEKVALVGNIEFLTRDGKLPLGRALQLEPSLAHDSERQVVTKTMGTTTGLQRHLVPNDLLPRYHQYLWDLYGSRARVLGWKTQPGDSDDVRLLRHSLVDVTANQAEDPELIAEAKELALAWMNDRQAVAPDMVNTVLSTAAIHGDRDMFERMRAAAVKESQEDLRDHLLYCLGMFRDPEVLKLALPLVLSDDFDPRESVIILYGAAQSTQGQDLAYNFVKDNWNALIGKLPTDSGASLPYVAAGFCDAGHYQDVEAFFQGRSTQYTGGPRTLAQVLEGINLCIAFKKAQGPGVAEFLENYHGAGDKTH